MPGHGSRSSQRHSSAGADVGCAWCSGTASICRFCGLLSTCLKYSFSGSSTLKPLLKPVGFTGLPVKSADRQIDYGYNPLLTDSVLVDIVRAEFEGDEYVAVELHYTFDWPNTKVFIFRVEEGTPKLILDSADSSYVATCTMLSATRRAPGPLVRLLL